MKQTAIVTGGSRGIGLAIAKQLGLDGYQVVVFATKPLEDCMEHLKELEQGSPGIMFLERSITGRTGNGWWRRPLRHLAGSMCWSTTLVWHHL